MPVLPVVISSDHIVDFNINREFRFKELEMDNGHKYPPNQKILLINKVVVIKCELLADIAY